MYSITTRDFNLDHTLSCGQVFRWEKDHDWWTGIVGRKIIRLKQEGTELLIDSSPDKRSIMDYFRLDDDMEAIYQEIGKDNIIRSLTRKYRGLHLIRQDPWECLVSYICSSNNTIKNISNSIRYLCECFGDEIEKGHYSFPSPEALSNIELCDMEKCKLGFRTPRVLDIASRVANREFDLSGIKYMPYSEARKKLVEIKGVGNKIADCVLLFAFEKLESFPVDTHIEKIMERHYGKNFKGPKSKRRDEIGEFARNYFGRFCGYAQEYLYLEGRS